MEYLFNYIIIISGIIIFIIGIIFLNYGIKQKKLTIHEATIKYKQKIKEATEEENRKFTHLQNCLQYIKDDVAKAENERKIAQQRAAEAQAATDRLLQSEQGRLTAELQNTKELLEIKMEQEQQIRQQQLNLLYQKQNQELEDDYILKKNKINSEILFLKSQLADFQTRQEAINKAMLRQKELQEKADFYSIQIFDNDKEDIKILQSMDLKLHNRDVIPKLIWELYIRRPCQEMIKRVTGGRAISGIYKITNKQTQEAYIGKTTDISTRWQNHLKTTIGLEGAAKSTLHTRLAADGLWNYTFEILEEVPKDKLSEREAFYINLYGTKKQLNMKEGSKNGTQ